MARTYQISLDDFDLGQILDALEIRAESWERTAEYLRTEQMPADEFFVIEDCSKPEEADGIAQRYPAIISNIEHQIQRQIDQPLQYSGQDFLVDLSDTDEYISEVSNLFSKLRPQWNEHTTLLQLRNF